MSRYFAFSGETGKHDDIIWTRVTAIPDRMQWNVWVGEERIGQISGSFKDGYTAISNADNQKLRGLRMVEGFRTRWAATEYLLNVGFRYGPENPMVVQELAWQMESEQRIRDYITAAKEREDDEPIR